VSRPHDTVNLDCFPLLIRMYLFRFYSGSKVKTNMYRFQATSLPEFEERGNVYSTYCAFANDIKLACLSPFFLEHIRIKLLCNS
jgi:hypothetical protein